jgi:hypothetical protein
VSVWDFIFEVIYPWAGIAVLLGWLYMMWRGFVEWREG